MADPRLVDIGRGVRALRHGLGLSMREVARRGGPSPPTIQRLEAGGGTNLRNLLLLADALGVSPSALVDVGQAREAVAADLRRRLAEVEDR